MHVNVHLFFENVSLKGIFFTIIKVHLFFHSRIFSTYYCLICFNNVYDWIGFSLSLFSQLGNGVVSFCFFSAVFVGVQSAFVSYFLFKMAKLVDVSFAPKLLVLLIERTLC